MTGIPEWSHRVLAERVRALTLELTGFPSVNGTPGESALGWRLAEMVKGLSVTQPLEVLVVPADGDPLARPVVVGRLRGGAGRPHDGGARSAVLLLAHYDVVDVEDYGPLRPLAFDPAALTAHFTGHGDALIRRQAQSGDYLFGRGILDMKSGVAACLAIMERLAQDPPPTGDVFIALAPDEEAFSNGAKTVRRVCGELERHEAVRFRAAINTDCSSPESPGETRHYGYLGSMGKLLPAVFVGSVPHHATHLRGALWEPAALVGRVLQHLTAHPDLADAYRGQATGPAVPLHVGDSRRHYDVQTLNWAWGYLNVLTISRTPAEVMDRVDGLTREALALATSETAARLGGPGGTVPVNAVVKTFGDLWDEFATRAPDEAASIQRRLQDAGRDGPDGAHAAQTRDVDADEPERNRQVVEAVWRAMGAPPMAVLFFARDLIPRVRTQDAALEAALADVLTAQGLSGRFLTQPFFPSISDMSFLTASPDDAHIDGFRRHYPLAPVTPDLAPAPTLPLINIGPSGFDAHRPTERVEVHWSFETMPHLVLDLVRALLRST